jgi:hypothetical protein
LRYILSQTEPRGRTTRWSLWLVSADSDDAAVERARVGLPESMPGTEFAVEAHVDGPNSVGSEEDSSELKWLRMLEWRNR